MIGGWERDVGEVGFGKGKKGGSDKRGEENYLRQVAEGGIRVINKSYVMRYSSLCSRCGGLVIWIVCLVGEEEMGRGRYEAREKISNTV